MAPKIVVSTVQAALLSAMSNLLAQGLTAWREDKTFHLDNKPLFNFVLFALLNTPPNILWQGFLESTFPGYTLQSIVTKSRVYSTDLAPPENPLEEDPTLDNINSFHTTNASSHGHIASSSSSAHDARVSHIKHGEHGAVTDPKERIAHLRAEELEEKKAQEVLWRQDVSMERRFDKRNTAIKFALDQTVGALVNTILYLAAMKGLEGAGWDAAIRAVSGRTLPLMMAGYKFWPLVSLLSFTVIPVGQRVVFGSIFGLAWGVFLSLMA